MTRSSSHPLRCLIVDYRLPILRVWAVKVGTGRAMFSPWEPLLEVYGRMIYAVGIVKDIAVGK